MIEVNELLFTFIMIVGIWLKADQTGRSSTQKSDCSPRPLPILYGRFTLPTTQPCIPFLLVSHQAFVPPDACPDYQLVPGALIALA